MAYAMDRGIYELIPLFIIYLTTSCSANDILGCGGFVQSHVKLDFSEIEIGLYTKEGSLKEKTECAPTNGYYFLPLYEKGDYVLKVHPPAGLSFEPSEVALTVDGVTDKCSSGQDINFVFNGFGINGQVVTLGQEEGPSGIAVQLVSEKGETRNTVTTVGGNFHFTAVIPGKYIVKASHPRWKLEPSQAEVQMKEGKMALPVGVVLTVKGYDVKGSITSFGSPISGVYVLLYSKEENPKYRVEGCNTALLQGVPDSPICHSVSDSSGEFTFGLVPAGEYKLIALSTTPGQVAVSYNVKPDAVPFSVKHDSLYIKNAFEVTGFTVVGSVESTPGEGMSGVQVLLDGKPIGTSDATGKFTLPGIQPGDYTVSFQHEKCEVEAVSVRVGSGGPRGGVAARVARWRVCGRLAPPHPRAALLLVDDATPPTRPPLRLAVDPQLKGEWCTFLAPGVYTAQVEVPEQEQREGLQYYPVSARVAVAGPVEGVSFSQLKGTVSGAVHFEDAAAAAARRLVVTLRHAPPHAAPPAPRTATVVDGRYTFTDVLPGTVAVSVSAERLCWQAERHEVAVTQAETTVPPFHQRGYVLPVHSTHDVQIEYESESSRGVLEAKRGSTRGCVATAGVYTLTPRGCHKFHPARAQIDIRDEQLAPVHFAAVAHAVEVRVTSPEPAADLTLTVRGEGRPPRRVGPLAAVRDGAAHVFHHTLYMADGEVVSVEAHSSRLLFAPRGPQPLVGAGQCQHGALTLRARAALTLAGRLRPPVPGVTLTLSSEDGKLTQITSAEGTYSFGPLDATQQYTIAAEKESYVFSAPDENGDIDAHKLAEIIVNLVDDADGTPLQGALVSVSGGAYRRNAGAAGGALRFASLSPAQYYVKPNMKEYRFEPPHTILQLDEGTTHTLTLRGVRTAWSCVGTLVSLSGHGWARVSVLATPTAPSPPASPSAAAPAARCSREEATTDAAGAFRIRGLLPECEYTVSLKESSEPELAGLRLVKAPATLKVAARRDLTGVRLVATQPARLTDGAVRVYAPNVDHYKSLRVSVSLEGAAGSVWAARLDAAGYSPHNNPGVVLVLPRLAADNRSYVAALSSSLPRAALPAPAPAPAPAAYFAADGRYKYIELEFAPQVKSSEQELRQSSFALLPLAALAALAYWQRARLGAAVRGGRAPRGPRGGGDAPSAEFAPHAAALGKKPLKKKAVLAS